ALAPLETAQDAIRTTAFALVALTGLDVVGLLVLAAYPESGFHQAHVLVTGLWSLAGLAVVVLAARRSRVALVLGFAWLALVLVKVLGYDWTQAGHHTGSWSLLLVGGALLAAGYLLRVLDESDEPLTAVAAATSPLALVLAVVAATQLVGFDFEQEPHRAFGVALLALAGLYAALGAAVFRSPRLTALSRLHWGLALPALWVGEVALIGNAGWIFVAWAATAIVLAALSYATSERGFQLGAVLILATGLVGAFAAFTPPDRLWNATAHPGSGIWVLVACIAGGSAV